MGVLNRFGLLCVSADEVDVLTHWLTYPLACLRVPQLGDSWHPGGLNCSVAETSPQLFKSCVPPSHAVATLHLWEVGSKLIEEKHHTGESI